MSETSTVSLRAKTAATANIFCQAMSFAYNYIVPICLAAPALGTGGTGMFWRHFGQMLSTNKRAVLLFVATSSCVWILIFFIVPETKSRSFTELDELFARKIPAWRFSTTETEEDKMRMEMDAATSGVAPLPRDA
jgi:SP family general alpha glucoside:H+ symporter-like MFS transporter